jgi:hypothetical protein
MWRRQEQGISTTVLKLLRFDDSTSWTAFLRTSGATADRKDFKALEKAMDLFTVLRGQSSNILHSIPQSGESLKNSWQLLSSWFTRPFAGFLRTPSIGQQPVLPLME